jgi:hypothetical protein
MYSMRAALMRAWRSSGVDNMSNHGTLPQTTNQPASNRGARKGAQFRLASPLRAGRLTSGRGSDVQETTSLAPRLERVASSSAGDEASASCNRLPLAHVASIWLSCIQRYRSLRAEAGARMHPGATLRARALHTSIRHVHDGALKRACATGTAAAAVKSYSHLGALSEEAELMAYCKGR